MKIVKPSYEILSLPETTLIDIEKAGRTCYKSEDKITNTSAPKFVQMLLNRGHESVLEHKSFSVKFICDRGVSHEFVRHRLASFSQESTRYCNYGKDDHLSFIIPSWITDVNEGVVDLDKLGATLDQNTYLWLDTIQFCETGYNNLIYEGWKPEQARAVLPNSLKTEIVITANLRQWREMFKQRTAKVAHPQMRELMQPLLDEIKTKIPVVFNDINY